LYSKILVLHFPSWEVEKPVVCHLTKYYDLIFTILKATILPRKEGIMVLELSGSKKNFKTAIQYLKDQGVIVKAGRGNEEVDVRAQVKVLAHDGEPGSTDN
jgi:ABC-type methionine transport system ATPase subunit